MRKLHKRLEKYYVITILQNTILNLVPSNELYVIAHVMISTHAMTSIGLSKVGYHYVNMY